MAAVLKTVNATVSADGTVTLAEPVANLPRYATAKTAKAALGI